jgi:hypothetical protein
MPLLADTRPDIPMGDMAVYRTLRPAFFLLETMMMFVLPPCEVHNVCSRMWQYIEMIILCIIILMCSQCVCAQSDILQQLCEWVRVDVPKTLLAHTHTVGRHRIQCRPDHIGRVR